MSELASVHAIIYGRVQGVFFRAFVFRYAKELGLTGYVRNLHGMEAVEVEAEGEKRLLKKLIEHLNIGPPASRVDEVITTWGKYNNTYSEFTIKY